MFNRTRPYLGRLLWRHRRAGAVGGVPPEYLDSEIGDTNCETVEVQFNEAIFSPTSDYKSGVTIKINSISQTIDTATRQANHAYVFFDLAANADGNDVVTFEYDDDFGDIEAEDDGEDLLDVSAQPAENFVGSLLFFDCADNSGWIGAI